MKTIYTYLVLSLMALTFTTQAKIWRVNNNPGAVADFTTLQAAHDGATNGDTVMLHPSATSYGSLNCIKRLVIIGAGYFLKENFPNYPTDLNSMTDWIILEGASSGTNILGIRCQSSVTISASNILIHRNYVLGILQISNNVSNVLVKQNFFNQSIQSSGVITNLQIRNNRINGISGFSSTVQATFSNNVFLNMSNTTLNGQILFNNINVGTGFTCNACMMSNNIDASGTSNATFGTANGNLGNLTSSAVFLDASGNSTDGRWRLRPGSPAIGAGVDGVDCGMFGGPDPYVLSGLPPVPAITQISSSGVGSNTTPLQVTVSMQSNN